MEAKPQYLRRHFPTRRPKKTVIQLSVPKTGLQATQRHHDSNEPLNAKELPPVFNLAHHQAKV